METIRWAVCWRAKGRGLSSMEIMNKSSKTCLLMVRLGTWRVESGSIGTGLVVCLVVVDFFESGLPVVGTKSRPDLVASGEQQVRLWMNCLERISKMPKKLKFLNEGNSTSN